ncbi:MAG: sigma 54-interacting transcriptional regulator [Candidatus Eisenbacteria bacterium]
MARLEFKHTDLPAGFRAERTLKSSDHGQVVLARREADDSRCVVKTVGPGATERFRNLFLEDVRIRRELSHPGLSPILDCGRLGNETYYAVSPYVDQTDPREWVQKQVARHFPEFSGRVAEPLAFLHERGHVHGDLKPGNLLFRASPRAIRELQLTDLAPAIFRREGTLGTIIGTPAYLAPEAIRGEEVDNRSDLYSLGVLLFEVLTGKPLFTGDPLELARHHLLTPARERFPARSAHPPAFREAIERLLEKDPNDRPRSAARFMEILEGKRRRPAPVVVPSVPPYVGRREIEDRVRRWLDPENPSCLLVAGSSGSGRTRFLRRMAGDLRLEGRAVLAIEGPATGPSPPYDGARRLFEAAGERGFPISFGKGPGHEIPHDLLRERDGSGDSAIFGRLRDRWNDRIELIRPRSHGDPVVIIDDADRLDEASLRYFVFLLTRRSPLRSRFVFALKEAELGRRGSLWKRLEAEGRARVEYLPPLTGEEIEEWLRGFLGPGKKSPELARVVAERSGGNPGLLRSLVEEWVRRGHVRKRYGTFRLAEGFSPKERAGDRPRRDPRMLGLEPGTRDLGGAIGLSPVPREARFLRRLLSLPAEDFREVIAPLLDMKLVRLEGSGDGEAYGPVSDEARTSLAGMIPESRRKKIHRMAARLTVREAKEGEGAPFVTAAHHWERAGCPGAARKALVKAASFLERMALVRESADLYRKSLRLGAGAPRAERARILSELARLRYREGDPAAALAAIRLLLRLFRDEREGGPPVRQARRLEAWIRFYQGEHERAERTLGDLLLSGARMPRSEEATIHYDLGWFAVSAGKPQAARDHLSRGLSLIGKSRGSALRGYLLNRLGAVAFYESDWREAGKLFERSIRSLERTAPSEAVGALSNLALVRLWTGKLEEARKLLETALTRVRESGNRLEEARVLEDLGRVLFRSGKSEEASRVLEQALEFQEDFGDEGGQVRALLSLGQMARERGRLDLSLDMLTRGLGLARMGRNPFGLFDALHLLALTHVAREEPEEAESLLEEAESVLGERYGGRYQAQLLRSRARLDHLRRKFDEAEDKLKEVLTHFEERGERMMVAETLILLARVALDRPDGGTPRPYLERLGATVRRGESPWISCRAALLRGRYEEGRGNPSSATPLFRDAARTARDLGARLDLAEALTCLGAVSARQGRQRRARGYVEEASSLYDLVRVVTPPPALAEAKDLLTGREGEIGEGFRAICRIAEVINSLRDTRAILDHTLDQAIDHLRADRGLILLRGPDGELVPRAARSLEGEDLQDVTRFSRTLFQEAERSEEPLVAGNVLADPRFRGAESVATYNILSAICSTIRSKGMPLGLLYLDSSRSANIFSANDLSFLRGLTDLAGIAIENARLLDRYERENTLLLEEVGRRDEVQEIVAESNAMRMVLRKLRVVAKSDIAVLLLGETGVGKGMGAGFLHREGPRGAEPFLRLNCSALAPTLVEDELFGHEKGAFTDAGERKAGIFERAHRGTLLLDEIGDMPLPAQGKLLRVLQEGEFERLGGTETLRANVRLIAATNRDLAALVAEGLFRNDLYYRLNGVAVEIPPLRNRREDIPKLAGRFLEAHRRRNRKAIRTISGAAEALLLSYSWPGNVRELDHVIERAVVFCEGGSIEPAHLPEEVRGAFPGSGVPEGPPETEDRDLLRDIYAVESQILRETLTRMGWNNVKAARHLGIHESTVRKKIKKYRLDRFRPPLPPPMNSYDRTSG